MQVKRTAGDGDGTRLIRIWAVDSVTPFEKVLVWTQNGSRNIWHNYFFLRGVRAENRDLKAQIEQMRLQQVRLSEDAEQAHRLQDLLAFRETVISKTVAAQVIGSSASDLSRSIYIDKGSNDKIAADMAVITSGGIVGKVLRVYPSTSLVLLINDQSSGVGAMLEKSRLQGVLRGTVDGEVVLERVMSDEQVTPGEAVMSSGGDQIFPKGLPIGTVMDVKPGKEMFLSIHIKPSADLSRLEEVLVVLEKQERSPVADSGVRVRAADILAQRLPSVPDKPVTPAVVAGGSAVTGMASAAVASGGVKTPGLIGGSAKPAGNPPTVFNPPVRNSTTGSPATTGSAPGATTSGRPNATTTLSAQAGANGKEPATQATGGTLKAEGAEKSVSPNPATAPAKPKANPPQVEQAKPVKPKVPPAQPPGTDSD